MGQVRQSRQPHAIAPENRNNLSFTDPQHQADKILSANTPIRGGNEDSDSGELTLTRHPGILATESGSPDASIESKGEAELLTQYATEFMQLPIVLVTQAQGTAKSAGCRLISSGSGVLMQVLRDPHGNDEGVY